MEGRLKRFFDLCQLSLCLKYCTFYHTVRMLIARTHMVVRSLRQISANSQRCVNAQVGTEPIQAILVGGVHLKLG
jgi:hypothetical protein